MNNTPKKGIGSIPSGSASLTATADTKEIEEMAALDSTSVSGRSAPVESIKEEKKTPGWVHFIAGGTGGTVAACITCPLEVIKTRLQGANSSNVATSGKFGTRTITAFGEIWTKEGVRGLFKGLGPNLVGIAPARALHFSTYSATKNFLIQGMKIEEGPKVHLTSAVVAGVSVHTITSPIWMIKTRMQLQIKDKEVAPYKNSFDCARRIVKEEGVKAFYKGLVASYIGVSETAIQFALYERLKLIVQGRKIGATSSTAKDKIQAVTLSPAEYLTTASISKLIASAVTYPHEVVRTRMREQRGENGKYKGFMSALRLIGREEGIRGLYGGMGAHMMRTVPNAAIMFLTYETVIKFLT
eukprot:TRINITY_DN3504_c0_g1_i1.p1 TRINITY_DN3504_c0_g1~~TRINITY_DN3504_c0_g1_i1.p1  ORF type:complete len:356 (-),score=58.93 TRINITY_DN3504_c0_g1_i1:174-1241(-)